MNRYHEGGHAVLLMALGRRFTRVTPTAVEFGPGDQANDLAAVHLSGVAAEVLAGGDATKAWRSAKTDAREAKRCAAELLEQLGRPVDKWELEKELETDWQTVIKTLRRNWHAVEQLAHRLEDGDVSYADALALWNKQ